MLKPRNPFLAVALQRLFVVQPSRSFSESKPAVSTITVPDSLNGLRADRVLLALLQNCQWSVIQRALGASCVRVRDGQSSETGRRIAADERIPVLTFPSWMGAVKSDAVFSADRERFTKPGDAAAIPRLESMLLLSTDALCVFNKPSGISVQGGTSTHAHIDAWAMAAHAAAAPWAMPLSPRLVHRLDKDTSGVLVMAKGREVASEWAQAFARGLIKKMYLAVVTPAPADADGVIVSEVYKGVPSGGSDGGNSRERMISRPSSGRRRKDNDVDDERSAIGAKSAVTEWKLLHRGSSSALLLLQPVTGRTHQLRVHCADVLKCHVVGDRKYGPASSPRDEAGAGGGRLQLHAAALVVPQSLVTPQLLKLCKPAATEHASTPASNAVVKLSDGRVLICASMPLHMQQALQAMRAPTNSFNIDALVTAVRS